MQFQTLVGLYAAGLLLPIALMGVFWVINCSRSSQLEGEGASFHAHASKGRMGIFYTRYLTSILLYGSVITCLCFWGCVEVYDRDNTISFAKDLYFYSNINVRQYEVSNG